MTEQTVKWNAPEQLPITHEADVIVIGGGPGGLGAAVMAARAGAKVMLIERYGFPGGMAVSGEVHPFMGNHAAGKCLDRPVYVEWLRAMKKYIGGEDGKLQNEEVTGRDKEISKDAAMLAAEDLLLEAGGAGGAGGAGVAGVELLYHHQLADAIVTDGRIDAIVLLSKSGLTAARAKMYVDCTGDADLAALSGCEIEIGGPSGHCQPMTLCFKLAGVDPEKIPSRKEITELFIQARQRGEIDCIRENVLMFDWLDPTVMHFNTTRVIHKNGVDGDDLSAAEIDGRRQVREFLKFFRSHVPGFEKARLYSIAHHMGVRETRRVVGINYITKDAFTSAAKFPDAISRVHYPIDIHNPDGTGTEIIRLDKDDYYEIPYGCVVPRGISNLTIGGRPISVDHAIHSSMRVMPPACTVGQAAGMAAAISVQKDTAPANLDGREIRKLLKEQGAYL